MSDGNFSELQVGDAVEFVQVMGDKGNAAARVWRAGAANRQDALAAENFTRAG